MQLASKSEPSTRYPHGGSTLTDMASIPKAKQDPYTLGMVRKLVDGYETMAATARSIFVLADATDNQASAELLTLRFQLDKTIGY